MINLIISEFNKLKRYNILWFAIFSVAFSAILAAFQTGKGNTFEMYSNNVIWNNYSLILPFTLVLIGGYIINREYTDNTLKNILTIPISFRKLLVTKLMVTGILTVIFSVFSSLCTIILSFIMVNTQGLTLAMSLHSLVQNIGMNFAIFIAVSPFIVFFARKPGSFFTGVIIAFFYGFCGIFLASRNLTDFYPITAGLGLIGFTGEDLHYSPTTGVITLLITLLVTIFIVLLTPKFGVLNTQKNKQKKQIKKK
ncbi:ABC transporter permease [Enterococcus faecalis]|uniref:ABC transporter permease n=1 Tax=Enterococcus faecalis TaxID=1351 RepID=UPI00157428F5|nr:ABC transporter permease [Enterococcus faecalis]HEL9058993.1 ABC transporter permease [Listeria monocytogenes]EHB5054278.1 ABC transporter permease [Enterococcus faecalis]EHF1810589.1 ABC transporter permease [Enterococcus faecalis]EJX8809622.1 ABC transporter permease [Enterococcus faecalis]MCD5259533.1 ABC transporter permease [Enterococcus faecalis]